MKWFIRVIMLFLLLMIGGCVIFQVAKTEAAPLPVVQPVKFGDRGEQVTKVQFILISHGYVSVTATGYFGPKTDKAVRHWQKVNGLVVDGIVGADTWKSLQASVPVPKTAPPQAPARPKKPKVAPPADPPAQEPVAPPEQGAGRLPVKSAEACADMSAYRQAAGLPPVFDSLGYREGGCVNDQVSRNGCCVGFFQVMTSHINGSGYSERIHNECGVNSRSDILGNSDAQKRANACVTFVMYDISGLRPWAL